MTDLVHMHALIHGRVQGVYYRAFAAHVARSLSVKGFVRNTRDGNVELEAEGGKGELDELLKQLKVGPPGARVDNIDTSLSAYQGLYHSFDVRY